MAQKLHSGLSDQWKASVHRLEDAEALLAASRWRGAMYLAGYAVECRLKWKLMQQWQCHTLEQLAVRLAAKGITDSPFTHSIELLFRRSGGYDKIKKSPAHWLAFCGTNKWLPSWRYSPDPGTKIQAEVMMGHVTNILQWIDHNL